MSWSLRAIGGDLLENVAGESVLRDLWTATDVTGGYFSELVAVIRFALFGDTRQEGWRTQAALKLERTLNGCPPSAFRQRDFCWSILQVLSILLHSTNSSDSPITSRLTLGLSSILSKNNFKIKYKQYLTMEVSGISLVLDAWARSRGILQVAFSSLH